LRGKLQSSGSCALTEYEADILAIVRRVVPVELSFAQKYWMQTKSCVDLSIYKIIGEAERV